MEYFSKMNMYEADTKVSMTNDSEHKIKIKYSCPTDDKQMRDCVKSDVNCHSMEENCTKKKMLDLHMYSVVSSSMEFVVKEFWCACASQFHTLTEKSSLSIV